jgi:hypothetical protein
MTHMNPRRRQFMAAILALAIAVPAMAVAMDWRNSPDELINRPVGPYACLPSAPSCDIGL